MPAVEAKEAPARTGYGNDATGEDAALRVDTQAPAGPRERVLQ